MSRRGWIFSTYPGEITWLEWALFTLGRPGRWLRGRTF